MGELTPSLVNETKKNKTSDESVSGTTKLTAQEWMALNKTVINSAKLIQETPTYNPDKPLLAMLSSAFSTASTFKDKGSVVNKLVLYREIFPEEPDVFLHDGMTFSFIPKMANTGPATIRFETSTTEINIKYGGEALEAGLLQPTVKYEVMYDKVTGWYNLIGGVSLDGTGSIASDTGGTTGGTASTSTNTITYQILSYNSIVDPSHRVNLVDTTAGPVTLTLPTPSNGLLLTFKDMKVNFGNNSLTLLPSPGTMIDNLTSWEMDMSMGSIDLVCVEMGPGNFNWYLI